MEKYYFSLFFLILVFNMDKSFLEIMDTNTFFLSFKEVVIQSVGVFLFISLICLVLSSLIVLNNFNQGICLFIAFEIIAFSVGLSILLISVLNKYYNMLYSKEPLRMSFRCVIIMLTTITLGNLVAMVFLGLNVVSFNWFSCLGWGVAGFYPSIVMLIKKNIFNEDSLKLNYDDESILGYNPVYYWFLGVVSGIMVFPVSFMNFYQNCDFCLKILFLMFPFILEFLILSPNLFNKILPFEVGIKKGFYLYFFISVIISFLFLLVWWFI